MSSTVASAVEEDESVLPLEEQTMRPEDTPIQQQRVRALHPILDPQYMIFTFLALAVIMIPVGFKLEGLTNQVEEWRQVYDSIDADEQLCGIGLDHNKGETCPLTYVVKEDMEPPILIYYEIQNFHQNHRFYTNSRDNFQLAGQVDGQDEIQAENCSPLNKVGNMTLNPCGLIANTFFNDVFTLKSGVDKLGEELVMIEKGIAWQSDLEHRFKMPEGYDHAECSDQTVACSENTECCSELGFSCETPALDDEGVCHGYHYPNADSTQYLYQTYEGIISPLEHVTNEHFAVWMRLATRPTFRKLYGYIEQPIAKGATLEFEVLSNYVVESFEGKKAFILTTTSIVGGRNPHLGATFYCIGFFFLGCCIIFALKHWFKPRKIADRKYLQYKED